MTEDFFRIFTRCIQKKAFWCCCLLLLVCALLIYVHSYRACAEMALFVMVGVFAIYEEYHEPD